MLHLALTALLAMQNASASPSMVPPSPEQPDSPSQPATTPGARATAPPGSTPTPRPSPTPTPGPRAYGNLLVVVNKSDNSVSVLDMATGKTRFTVPVEKGPHEAEVLAGGKTVAVSNYGRAGEPGQAVTVIDLANGKVLSRIDLGAGSKPHGLKSLSNGNLLVTAEGKRELVVVDPRNGAILQRVPTGKDVSHMVAASPDRQRAYVTSLGSGAVTVIDLVSGKAIQDIATGKGAEGLDVTPDGSEVWVANRDTNTISVIDTRTLKVVSTIKAASFPIRVKITPDGRRAIVAFAGSGDVGVFDAATRAEVKRIPIGRDAVAGTDSRAFAGRFGTSPAPIGLLIAPDGRRAWIAASHADVVAVVDLDKLRIEDAWTVGREPDGLAGRFVAK